MVAACLLACLVCLLPPWPEVLALLPWPWPALVAFLLPTWLGWVWHRTRWVKV